MPPDDPFAEFGGKMDEDPFAEFGGKMEAAQPTQPKSIYYQGGKKPVWEDEPVAAMPEPGTSQGWSMPGQVQPNGVSAEAMGSYSAPPPKRLVSGDIDWNRGTFPEKPSPASSIDARTAGDILGVYSRWSPEQQKAKMKELGMEWQEGMTGQMVGRSVTPTESGATVYGPWESLEGGQLRAFGHTAPAAAGATWGLLLPFLGTAAGAGGMEAFHQARMGASPPDALKNAAVTGGTMAALDALPLVPQVVSRGADKLVSKLEGNQVARSLLGKPSKPPMPASSIPAAANPVDDALRATVDDMSPEDAAKALQELMDNPPPPNMAATVEDMAKAIPEAPKPLPRAPVETPQVPSAAPATSTLTKSQMARAVKAHGIRQELEAAAPKPEGVEYINGTIDDIYSVLKDAPRRKVMTKAGEADAVEIEGRWVSSRGKPEKFKGLLHADPNGPSIAALDRPNFKTVTEAREWANAWTETMGPVEFKASIRRIAAEQGMEGADKAGTRDILNWFRKNPRGETSGRGAEDPRQWGLLRLYEPKILRAESKRFGGEGYSLVAPRDMIDLKVGGKTYRIRTPGDVPVETPETAQALRDLVQPRVSGGVPSGAPEALPGAPAAPGGLQAETAGLQPETVSAARRFMVEPTGDWGKRLAAKAVAQRDKDLAKGAWSRMKGKRGFRALMPFGVGTAAATLAGIPWNQAVVGMAAGGALGRLARPYALDAAAKVLTRPQSPLTPAWRAAAYSLAERQRREKAATPPPR